MINTGINTTENLLIKRTILILASSPTNTARLRLDREMREIDAGLRRAKQREQFTLEQKWAVRPDDLRRALLDYNPQIVHFCGHGAGYQGLVLENDVGEAQFLPTNALASLFKLFANRGVECVVLNACYAEVQAEAISQHINYVMGMSDEISDDAAVKFAIGFYDAVGAGWSYEDAYELGCNAIALEGIPEELTPVLKKKDRLIISNSNVQFSQRTLFAVRHHSFELLTGLISEEDLSNNIRDYKFQHIEFDQSSFFTVGICDPSSAIKQNENFVNDFLKLFKANPEAKICYYGIVHIPLQFCVGYAFSTWPKVLLFELDRNTNCWYQLASSDSPEIELNVIISRVKNPVAVAIRIAISFDILKSDVDDVLSQPYEDILIQIGKRRIDAISHYSQVNKICQAFRQVLDDLHNRLDKSLVVHIFYTGPVSLGFSLGRRISRTIHHQVIVYNYTANTQPCYAWGIKINSNDTPASRVVWTTPIITKTQE
ncbi:SAVED domain-containing protein [Nostoc sp. KVJ3]|uniref:SAVED domain-containing protein n=1 Tax=Nostoc sp. KVJ3 TaxID=457945 RepID=UPI0022372DCC|nr:SAVED domain-containing protein [Nostoc sp. KVJ3]